MSELAVSGKIKQFLDVESGVAKASGKEWKKQNFLISNNDGYEGKEQVFCFEVFGEEKVTNLTKFQKVGDEVSVQFNIGCNEWKGKYFTSLSAWRIEKKSSEEVSNQAPEQSLVEEQDDLPF